MEAHINDLRVLASTNCIFPLTNYTFQPGINAPPARNTETDVAVCRILDAAFIAAESYYRMKPEQH